MPIIFQGLIIGSRSRDLLTSMVSRMNFPIVWTDPQAYLCGVGSIICLWMFNSKTIVLNDYATASALLDHRSTIYSSRPIFWMSGYLTDRMDNVFLTKTTSPRFKIYRTLLHKTLNPRAIQTYRALQVAECQTLLRGLLETPDKFIAHLRR
jgi:cytochrome P450